MQMRRLYWLIIIFIALLQFGIAVMNAFSTSWNGNIDQWLTIFWSGLIVVAAVVFGRIWARGGWPELRRRLTLHREGLNSVRGDKTASKLSVILWVVVGVALVVVFNVMGHR
jgi:hypothetical protein